MSLLSSNDASLTVGRDRAPEDSDRAMAVPALVPFLLCHELFHEARLPKLIVCNVHAVYAMYVSMPMHTAWMYIDELT